MHLSITKLLKLISSIALLSALCIFIFNDKFHLVLQSNNGKIDRNDSVFLEKIEGMLPGTVQVPSYPDGEENSDEEHSYNKAEFNTEVTMQQASNDATQDPSDRWRAKRHELAVQNSPKKLLMLAYSKGGSSIGRSMFDTDPDIMFWCEALSPYFLAYYGLHYSALPQKALYTANLTRIQFTEQEQKQMAEYIHNMFYCKFDNFPSHALVHEVLGCSRSNRQAFNCINGTVKEVCQSIAPFKTCGLSTEEAKSRKCPELLQKAHQTLQTSLSPFVNTSTETLARILKEYTNVLTAGETRVELDFNILAQHEICVETIKRNKDSCSEHSMEKCQNSKFHVIETTRMKMEELDVILQTIPDLYVMHYIRDPRGIALARLQKDPLWTVDDGKSGILAETKYLCDRIRYDIKQRKLLEKKYRSVFIQVKYEDLVLEPVITAHAVYQHVGNNFPESSDWPAFAAKAIHGSVEDRQKVFRTNGTKSLTKWRNEVDKTVLVEIRAYCLTLLQELQYPLL